MRERSKIAENMITILLYFILVVGVGIVLLPFIWMTATAFKPYTEMFRLPIHFLPAHPTLENFSELAYTFPLPRLLFNSFLIAGVASLSSVFFATMVGYGLAKFRSPGLNVIFIVILSSIMIPPFIRVIPLYLTMVRWGGNNTYWGVIVVNYVSVFGIFLMRQYALSVPDELIDAARIDGASEPRILMTVVFPLLRPACITLGVIKFLWTWNEFLWPLVMLTDQEMMTLPIALATLKGHLITRYGPLMAGAVVVVVPVVILFIFLQKYIVRGIALTGFK
jgi:multiple sugar transport system permease protein